MIHSLHNDFVKVNPISPRGKGVTFGSAAAMYEYFKRKPKARTTKIEVVYSNEKNGKLVYAQAKVLHGRISFLEKKHDDRLKGRG